MYLVWHWKLIFCFQIKLLFPNKIISLMRSTKWEDFILICRILKYLLLQLVTISQFCIYFLSFFMECFTSKRHFGSRSSRLYRKLTRNFANSWNRFPCQVSLFTSIFYHRSLWHAKYNYFFFAKCCFDARIMTSSWPPSSFPWSSFAHFGYVFGFISLHFRNVLCYKFWKYNPSIFVLSLTFVKGEIFW